MNKALLKAYWETDRLLKLRVLVNFEFSIQWIAKLINV